MSFFSGKWPNKDLLLTNRLPNSDWLDFFQLSSMSVHSSGGQKIYLNNFFSGYFYQGENLFFDTNNVAPEKSSVGSFIFADVDLKKTVIFSDFFGLSLLYLCKFKDFWCVTNRYQIALEWLNYWGAKKLNTDSFIRGLGQTHQPFQQRHNRQSDCDNIELVPLDSYVEIRNGKAFLEEKKEFLDSLFPLNESYHELIIKASEDLKRNVSAITNSSFFDNFICDLSGGFDSRLVLSSISNIKNYEDIFKIRTLKVSQGRDVEIASTLASSLGLDFIDKHYGEQYFWNPELAYAMATSYFLGEHYNYGASAWSTKGTSSRTCRISGGCGELYRAINIKESNFGKKDIDISDYWNKGISDSAIFDKTTGESLDTLRDELSKLPGSKEDKIELHYIYYRNRIHYGMRGWDNFHDCPTFFPTLSINMFKASRMLSAEERASEKVMLDVTHRLFPILTSFPYDSKSNFDRTNIFVSDERFKKITLPILNDIEKWKKSTKRLEENKFYKRRKITKNEALIWRDVDDFIFNDAIKKLDGILTYYKIPNFTSSPRDYLDSMRGHPLLLRTTIRKILSFYEQI